MNIKSLLTDAIFINVKVQNVTITKIMMQHKVLAPDFF